MDVQNTSDRVFSILNDNDSPSFVIRQRQSSPSSPPTKLPSFVHSPRLERPNLLRQSQYQRNSSISSSAGSPPLLRFDSSSSKSSSSSMDSTPSPITPAYNYNDAALMPYDNMLRQDLGSGYLPSPSTITPFMEQQMMIAPQMHDQLPSFTPKAIPSVARPAYPTVPAPHPDLQQLPTPTLSNNPSVSSNSSAAPQSKTSPSNNTSNPANTGKKNKYPCPYAVSHNCLATFTTSGHAARHGKKHTGEKGVHCPVCNKAFTRKDNMKQHERTHKNNSANNSNSDESSRRSKAAITKDAQKAKAHTKTGSEVSSHARKSSLIQSPLSEVTSLAPNTVDTPINVDGSSFYHDPAPQMLMATEATMSAGSNMPVSLYPPLGDETLLSGVPASSQSDKLNGHALMPSVLLRGFSDLDTLAQAAESFDPYYQTQFGGQI